MRDAVGIDVSKDMPDAFRLSGKEHRMFSNTRSGVRSLMNWLEGAAPRIVVFEATGVCHRLLETVLAAKGMANAQVNPRQARRFAEGTGALARADRVDASMLAKMGALLDLEASEPRSARLHDLRAETEQTGSVCSVSKTSGCFERLRYPTSLVIQTGRIPF